MNGAEQRAHRRDSDEQARQHRQRGERHGAGRTVYEDQYQEDQRARHPREPAGVVLDRRARARGKHARPADQHAVFGTRPGGLKGARQGVSRLLLAHRIHSRGRGLREKECASAVPREPDAVPRSGRPLTRGLGEALQFAGRIARDHSLERRSFERREPFEVFTQRAGERFLAEALGTHRRAQQIAMLQAQLARALSEFRGAVYDIVEAPVGCEYARESAGEARELRWRTAFDCDQHGAGGHAFAQLLDEEPLQAAAGGGEEGGQIGGEGRVARGPPGARRDDREPGEERGAPMEPHGDSSWMVITEPSPPGSRISRRTMREPEPAMTMPFTTPAISTSLGVSASVQRCLVPPTLTE